MKIIICGYGKMGKEIEKIALSRKHDIIARIDNEHEWKQAETTLTSADVAIDFSMPESVVGNIYRLFSLNIPVVTGTTGWNKHIEEVKDRCIKEKQALMFASNFSIGVNVFFALNKKLAEMMHSFPQYDVRIEETHHTQKLDSPSGTAISLANDIIAKFGNKDKWVNEETSDKKDLEIKSFRIGNTTGKHNVIYHSEIDTIEIIHNANNRSGFALGAVMAAEWIIGKKGFFGMNDMLHL